jgi:hypothetical protein
VGLISEKPIGRENRDALAGDAMNMIANLSFAHAVDGIRRVTVLDKNDRVPAPIGLANRRIDAELGLHSRDHDAIDRQTGEDFS